MADIMVRMIVSAIPRDVLEEFDWCHWTKFSLESLLILHERQRRMKVLQALTVDQPEGFKDAKVDSTIFQRCRKLELFIDTRESLDMAQSFLEKFPMVEDIVLHSHFKEQSSLTTRELNDAPTAPGLITRTLFKHMLPFETCTPMANLTSLSLRELNFKQCLDTYCRVIDFTKITSLRLVQCVGTDTLLSNLCKAHNLPHKLELLEVQCKNTEEDVVSALDVFLCLISGLEDLTIEFDKVGMLPSIDGIVKHSKTLKTLILHGFKGDSTDEEIPLSVSNFRNVCTACSNLEQLSCAFPATLITSGIPATKWKSFATAVTTSLLSLRTLQITNWPGNRSGQKKLPATAYHPLLRALAQTIFELPHDAELMEKLSDDPLQVLDHVPASPKTESKLRLIAFGMCNVTWLYKVEDRSKTALFYRSEQFLLDRRTFVPVAIPVDFYAAQYIEPRCDILNHYYLHDVEMPVTKSGSRNHWSSDDDDEDEEDD